MKKKVRLRLPKKKIYLLNNDNDYYLRINVEFLGAKKNHAYTLRNRWKYDVILWWKRMLPNKLVFYVFEFSTVVVRYPGAFPNLLFKPVRRKQPFWIYIVYKNIASDPDHCFLSTVFIRVPLRISKKWLYIGVCVCVST